MASILSETGRICRDFHRLFTGNVVLVVFAKTMEVNVMKRQTQKKTEYSIALRPASREEAGLFYSELDEGKDEALGTVGHLRLDFGSGGKEFWSTWWPHNRDQLNTPEFKQDLQEFVDALRESGPLKNLAAMGAYCRQQGGAITEDGRSYGYIAETEHYRYCLRCTPYQESTTDTCTSMICDSRPWPSRTDP